jgi:hypothetical protein
MIEGSVDNKFATRDNQTCAMPRSRTVVPRAPDPQSIESQPFITDGLLTLEAEVQLYTVAQ